MLGDSHYVIKHGVARLHMTGHRLLESAAGTEHAMSLLYACSVSLSKGICPTNSTVELTQDMQVLVPFAVDSIMISLT